MAANEGKKLPTRRCTGCGEHFPKTQLVRILRTPDGEIKLDLTGKLSGRGAYVCKSIVCLRKARRAARIENSLECKIPEAVYESIEAQLGNE